MNYPKMLYKGEAKYGDNEQLRMDLNDKKLKTIIVNDEGQEVLWREKGYVDLVDLMSIGKAVEKKVVEIKKRGRPKKVVENNVSPNTA